MRSAPMFPVLLKDDAFTTPDADTSYVIAGNGLFLERRTELYAATVRVDGGVAGLLPHEARLDLRLPRPLPRSLVETALGFFRSVYERWEGEAVLFLFYAPAADGRRARYRVEAPPQTIRGRVEHGRFRADLRLSYGPCARPGPEWRKLGTMHSHAELSPRHSLVDEHDELFETGLHVTVGYVGSTSPEFDAAFVVAGTRFPVPPEQVLEPAHTSRAWPPEWLERIRVVEERRTDGKHGYAWSH